MGVFLAENSRSWISFVKKMVRRHLTKTFLLVFIVFLWLLPYINVLTVDRFCLPPWFPNPTGISQHRGTIHRFHRDHVPASNIGKEMGNVFSFRVVSKYATFGWLVVDRIVCVSMYKGYIWRFINAMMYTVYKYVQHTCVSLHWCFIHCACILCVFTKLNKKMWGAFMAISRNHHISALPKGQMIGATNHGDGFVNQTRLKTAAHHDLVTENNGNSVVSPCFCSS